LDVRNTSRVPITAVLAEGKRQLVEATHPLLSVKSFDSALEPYAARSLESGQTYRFVFFGPKPEPARLSRRTVAVRAVLFADGGTWGDQEWIDTLLSLRRTAYRCENDALQAMQEAEMHPSIGEPILQKLDEMQKAEEGGARSVYDRIVIGRVFKEVITNIVGASQIEASLPHSFEPKKLAPSAPKMDSAIQATAYRIRSLKAAGLTSSM
jgi:hypothetical protein